MSWIILLLSLFINNKNHRILSNYVEKNIYEGTDYRFLLNSTEVDIKIMYEYHIKKNLLDILENNEISEYNKILFIEKYKKYLKK
jgi:hypothetical protein